MHEAFAERSRRGGADVLFLGDSITYGWTGAGRAAWEAHLAPLGAACHGIPGDRTEHLLWRLTHGELEGLSPKVVVVHVGTNNLKSGPVRQPPREVAEGVRAVVMEALSRCPSSRVLLVGILPRQPGYEWMAAAVAETNRLLARLADGRRVRFADTGGLFLDDAGNLRADLMGDLLHPNARGYEAWARALAPLLRDMMAALP
jgi:lysophospholipase L1-like esterase